MTGRRISPAERFRILTDILSGRLTAGDAAVHHDVPVGVVTQWLREIPVAAPVEPSDRPAGATAPSRPRQRPLPRCRFVVDEMVQGLGLQA